jgi:hypothetical protein
MGHFGTDPYGRPTIVNILMSEKDYPIFEGAVIEM